MSYRSYEAEIRRLERAERKRSKELERQMKERAKLDALAQARLEVAAYEAAIDVLLSVHKEQSDPIDWPELASALPPVSSAALRVASTKAKIDALVPSFEASSAQRASAMVVAAEKRDREELQNAPAVHAEMLANWQRRRDLARRVCAGEGAAYCDALASHEAFEELHELGVQVEFTCRGTALVECVIRLDGTSVVPPETKSLAPNGKLLSKPTPRGRLQEIYQDYVCGCALRAVREIFATVPAGAVLLTAEVPIANPERGTVASAPVLSVCVARDRAARLDYARIDPSDAIESLPHRCNFKATRKSGAFEAIVPLRSTELHGLVCAPDFPTLLAAARRMRTEMKSIETPSKP